ncbi:hypothetical protein BC629DRAFT_1599776 [Irpex lacteus]|nr:hypothetical protein BC629DRAFT_1599776 [Irpex lacteus]
MSRLNQAFSDDEFGADVLSSPTAPGRHQVKRLVARNSRSRTPTRPSPSGKVLVHGTPTPSKKKKKAKAVHRSYGSGTDLRDIFEDWDDLTSEIDEWCEDSMESTQSSGGGPVTPDSCTQARADICVDDLSDEVILDDDEEIHEREAAAAREAKVASGWWERWAYKGAVGAGQRRSKLGTLRRRETTVTSEGRHREYSPRSAGGGGGKRKREDHDLRSGRQKGLRHVEDVKRGESLDDVNGRSGGTSSGSEGQKQRE